MRKLLALIIFAFSLSVMGAAAEDSSRKPASRDVPDECLREKIVLRESETDVYSLRLLQQTTLVRNNLIEIVAANGDCN